MAGISNPIKIYSSPILMTAMAATMVIAKEIQKLIFARILIL